MEEEEQEEKEEEQEEGRKEGRAGGRKEGRKEEEKEGRRQRKKRNRAKLGKLVKWSTNCRQERQVCTCPNRKETKGKQDSLCRDSFIHQKDATANSTFLFFFSLSLSVGG